MPSNERSTYISKFLISFPFFPATLDATIAAHLQREFVQQGRGAVEASVQDEQLRAGLLRTLAHRGVVGLRERREKNI